MSEPIIRWLPAARQDLVAIAKYFEVISPALADRFQAAVETTLTRLVALPGMGSLAEFGGPHLAEVRVWPIKRFKKYLIFYRPIDSGIEVLRVSFGSRNFLGFKDSAS